VTPAGALAIAAIVSFAWFTVVTASYVGKKQKEKRVQAIEENPQKYLSDNLGNGIGGRVYRGAAHVDAAIDRASRPADEFVGLTECPSCATLAYHHIARVSKRYVFRECTNIKCKKKWRQAK
jgi:hypothetical protein